MIGAGRHTLAWFAAATRVSYFAQTLPIRSSTVASSVPGRGRAQRGAHNVPDIQKVKTLAFKTWAFRRESCKGLGGKWVQLAGAAP